MEQKTPKPLLAYSVTEEFEGTGGIVFARSAIAARRIGADRYADGEFENARCRRAPYADEYAESGIVPASRLIEEGWHFECSGCSRTIDNDYLWEMDIEPSDVVGSQDSSVYCNELCEAYEALGRAQRKVFDRRWMRRLVKFVKARFPEAEIIRDSQFRRPYVYGDRRNGQHLLRDANIPFTLPCLEHGPASLVVERHQPHGTRYGRKESDDPRKRSVFFVCHPDDREAINAYMKANPPRR